MKNIFYLILGIAFLWASCQSSDKQKGGNSNEFSEAKDAVSGKTGRDNLETLLTEAMVRRAFNISDSTEVKVNAEDYICTYEWEQDSKDENLLLSYRVSMNFGNKRKMDNKAMNAVWESQNKRVYKDKNLQPVTGVGDKASWSSLAGGQLRVASNGNLFYISLSSHKINMRDVQATMNEHAWTKEKMIEKSKELARGVIAKM